jgi:hypothetical protein
LNFNLMKPFGYNNILNNNYSQRNSMRESKLSKHYMMVKF